MPQTVTVLTLHGIGTYADEEGAEVLFDEDLRSGVTAQLPAELQDRVRFQPVYWSNHQLLRDQQRLFNERAPSWPWKRIFRFVIESLSDATAFQLPASADEGDWRAYRSSAYAAIQHAVRDALATAEQEAGVGPVVVAAQSMGCHVLSQYAWDAAEAPTRLLKEGEDPEALSDFVRLRTLHSAIFTGCNIPILTMNVQRPDKVPLGLPGRGPRSVWLNLYDPDDPLGYGLEPEYASYFAKPKADPFTGQLPADRAPSDDLQPSDHRIEVRSLGGLTPFAHRAYWRQNIVHRSVAQAIRNAMADAKQETIEGNTESGRKNVSA